MFAVIPGASAIVTNAVLLVVGTGELGKMSWPIRRLMIVDLPAEKWPTKVIV